MDELKEFRAISDMYLAAALISYGLRPARIDRTNLRRQKFFFDAEREVEVLVSTDLGAVQKFLCVDEVETYYIAKQLYLAGSYPDALKEVKSTIHSYIEDNDGYTR